MKDFAWSNYRNSMRRPRAIIIDDEACIRDMMMTFLSRHGFEVVECETPSVCPIYTDRDGTCSQELRCADIFITDLTMPGLNGLDLIERQKRNGCKVDARNKAVISGNIDHQVMERAKDAGCASFAKPFRLSEIAGWLKECEERISLNVPLEPIERRKERRHSSMERRSISLVVEHSAIVTGTVLNESLSGVCVALNGEIHQGEDVIVMRASYKASPKAQVRWVRGNEGSYIAGLLYL